MTDEHVEHRTLHDFAIDPDHEQRTESAEFREAKRRLHEDGHMQCYVESCKSTKDLQVHHFHCEWMFAAIADWTKVKAAAEKFDIYGYGRLLKNKPITSPDDVRCMMVLCKAHHTGINHEDGGGGTGIHMVSHPTWNAQNICVDGANPIPQAGETFAKAAERIKKHERSAGS